MTTDSTSAAPRLDVVGIGNALVDVLSHESDDFVTKHDLSRGAMTLDRHRPRRVAVRGHGPGTRGVGGLGRELDGRCRVVRRHRGIRRPGQRRPARRGLRPRHPRCGGRVHDRARGGAVGRRRAHRPLPDHRDARRAAHAQHVPRRIRPARSGGSRPRAHRSGAGAVPRGLPVGRAGSQGRIPRGGTSRARRREPRRVHAVGRLLRRPPPRRVPRAGRAGRRRAVRERGARSRRCTRSTPSTTRCNACSTTARSPRSLAARRAR